MTRRWRNGQIWWTLAELRRHADALAAYDAALALHPGHQEAAFGRANLLRDVGWLSAAVEGYDAVIAVAPAHPRANLHRAQALRDLRRTEEAQAGFEQTLAVVETALAARPNDPRLTAWRGIALEGLQRDTDALASFDRAVALAPGFADPWNNRGVLLARIGREEDARESFGRAVAARPDFAEAMANHASMLMQIGDWQGAEALLDRALAASPNLPAAHFARAALRLIMGRFEEGWAEYELRWQLRDVATLRPWFGALPSLPGDSPAAPGPGAMPAQWRGEKLAGRKLLVYGEQGFGDTLQFCRYVPLLERLEGGPVNVVLLVQPALRRLLASLPGVAHLVQEGDPKPELAFHCPVFSLPYLFGTTLETVPAPPRYLAAAPERRAHWRARLAGAPGPRVGLVWSGNQHHRNDRNRSIPLAMLEPLANTGASFFSLQREVRGSDAATLARFTWIDGIGTGFEDFAETAAAIAELDLVIAVDTSVVHLAGALGRPTWVMLPFAPDYRWMLGRDDSPWYPSLRLFRQPAPRDWASVIAAVQAALAAFVATLPGARPA